MDKFDVALWRKDQYQTDEKLKKRIALHSRFGTNPQPWMTWVRQQLPMQEGCRVLDLGCGPGDAWKSESPSIPSASQIMLVDRSMGMLRAARTSLPTANDAFLCCDAQQIPLKSNYFDLLLANHLLFLLPDITAALEEIRRILKPGGSVCATTYGWDNLQELFSLVAAVKPTPFPDPLLDPQNAPRRFALENGPALLKLHFDRVEMRPYFAHLRVTEVQPLLDYIQSIWLLTTAEETALREQIEQEISENGCYFISKSQGMLLAQ